MSVWFHRFAIVLVCIVLALPAAPAAAQQPPAPTPYTPPSGSGLPVIPAVPAVPTIGRGQSLSLTDAVATALQKNYVIQQAALQVALDRATLAQAEAGLWPTVQYKASYTQQTAGNPQTLPIQGNITISGVPTPFSTTITLPGSQTPAYATSFALTYPLYTGNALQDQVTIAQQKVAADQAAFAAQAATIVLQARQAYYNVEAAAALAASGQRAVDASRENVRVTQAQVTVGTSPQFNLLQAQTQLASALQTLAQQKAAAVQAQYTLAIVLNLPQATIVTPATPLGLPNPPQDLNTLIQMALRQRPELQQARANIAGAQAAIDLAKAGLRPNITVSGGPFIQTNNLSSSPPVDWTGTIALTLTIFDGGLTKSKVQAAQVQLQQAQVSEQQTEQSVESQVRTSYLNLQQAAEQLVAAEAGLVSAREQLRIANVRFQAGVGTQLEVVTAIQNLASADSSVIAAEYNYNLALAQIDQAVGTQVQVPNRP
ncbi:MAG TPA: TolC family protein [bacterium]|nr:TolC family protein [bacterium]